MTDQFVTVSNGELISEATFDGSEAEENGCFIIKGLIDTDIIENIQDQILSLLRLLAQDKSNTQKNINFEETSEKLIYTILSQNPQLRKTLVDAIRSLPIIQSMSSNQMLLDIIKKIGIEFPLLRMNALQVYLPWENLFHENKHQDHGSMVSENSWTIQIPLQSNTKFHNGGPEIFPGSYKLGPLEHQLIRSPKTGYLHEVIEKKLWNKKPSIYFDTEPGDAIFFRCLNIHKSYEFEKTKREAIRWAHVIRFDDCAQAGFPDFKSNKYSHLRNFDTATWTDEKNEFLDNYKI